jgi:hypothetical protein
VSDRPLTHWNHRIIRCEHDGAQFFRVHEVYYDGDVPTSWTENPVSPIGETLAELADEIGRFANACLYPVLEVKDGVLVKVEL